MSLMGRCEIRTGVPIGFGKAGTGPRNRRGEQRFRYATSVMVLNRHARFPATMIDVSDSGARMRLEQAVILQSACVLSIAAFGLLVPSVVVWRRGCDLGVRFVTAPVTVAPDLQEPRSFGRRRLLSNGN